MDIRTLPEWVVRMMIIGVVLGVLYGSGWLYRALQGAPRRGQVAGSAYCAGAGFLGLFGGVFFGVIGVFFSDLSAPGQLAPWLGLVGSFLLAGGLILFAYSGVLARYDAAGLEIRTWRRAWRAVAWRDVRRLKIVASGQSLKIETRRGRSMSLPTDTGGLAWLVEAAAAAGVEGAAEVLSGPPSRG